MAQNYIWGLPGWSSREGGWGLIPGQEIRSHMLQLKALHTEAKI